MLPRYGFITSPELFAKHGRDVFIHKQFVGTLSVGDTLEFDYRLNDQGQPQVARS